MRGYLLSVATLVALNTSAFASNGLVDALTTNSQYGGELRLMYTNGNNTNVLYAPHNDDVTGTTAIELDYKTGDFYGFKLGVSGRVSWDLRLHNEDRSSEDDSRNTLTTRDITQAYLEYGYSNSSIKVGRQYLTTPLLDNSTGKFQFIVMDTLDAVNVKMGEIDNTMLQLTYVDRWNKKQSNDAYSTPIGIEDDIEYENGLWSLYATNNTYEPLKLEAQYMIVGAQQDEFSSNGDAPVFTNGAYDQYFVKANYSFPTSIPINIEALYGGVDFDKKQRTNTSDRTDVYGTQLGVTVAGFTYHLAYTSVGDGNDWLGTNGDRPDNLLYTLGLGTKAMFAGSDTYKLSAMKKFDKAWAYLIYLYGEQSEEGQRNSSQNLNRFHEVLLLFSYDMSSILKGLSSDIFVSYTDYDGDYARATTGHGSEHTYGRYFLTYKF